MAGKKLLVTSCVLVATSVFLQLVGFLSPGWEVMRYTINRKVVNRHYGLWYTCTEEGCEAGKIDEPLQASEFLAPYLKTDDTVMLVAQITAPLSLLFSVLALVFNAVLISRFKADVKRSRDIHLVLVVMCLLGGILALIGSGNFANRHVDVCTQFFNVCMVPYSLLVFGVGGIVICVAFIVNVIDLIISSKVGR